MELLTVVCLLVIVYVVATRLPDQSTPASSKSNRTYLPSSAQKRDFKPNEHSVAPDVYDLRHGKWFRAGEKVLVQGYQISGGLIYVGENLLDNSGYRDDACLINPKLRCKGGEPWQYGEEMGYWPYYGSIPDRCRGSYLKWLAGGRVEPEAYIGYVFCSSMVWSVVYL